MFGRLAGALVAVVVAAGPARAGVEVGTLSPRAIGHAGANLASDDGAAAAFLCPAAIARRDQRRAQLAAVAQDDEASLTTATHPRVDDVGGAAIGPLFGAQGHLGPVVLAVSLATTEQFDHQLAAPATGLPTDEVAARYPHRYGGLTASWTRRTLAAAAAVRLTDSLAVGAAVTLGQVDVAERRRLWAGFAGRDPLARPDRDIDVTVTAGDGLVPGGAVGLLYAPLDAQLELAAGVAWSDDARVDGEVAAVATGPRPIVTAVAPTATARFGAGLTAAVGARWLSERYAVETAASWTAYPTGATGWTIRGVEVVDESGARARLTALPSRLPRRAHGAVAAAVDVAAVPGFAWRRWATAGRHRPARGRPWRRSARISAATPWPAASS
ncbi:MAG: outer membrane protein transport protein [Kofleriaceae bacterium]